MHGLGTRSQDQALFLAIIVTNTGIGIWQELHARRKLDRLEARVGYPDRWRQYDGLRIELVEGKDGDLFFELGSAVLKPAAQRAIGVIASELRGASKSVGW